MRASRIGGLALVCALGSGHSLHAQDCSIPLSDFPGAYGSSFNVTASGFTAAELQTSIGYWSACSGYGTDFPVFQIGGSGGIPIVIERVEGRSTASRGGCGQAINSESTNGFLTRVSITVWTHQVDGASCIPLMDTLAHEFGHALGLGDVGTLSGCSGHIMGQRAFGNTRTVNPDDCQMADIMWAVPGEGSITSPTPILPTPTPTGGSATPLVLDLDQGGFRFSDVRNGVRFDLDADGFAEGTAWVEERAGDGFLVLDRDGDGWITSGAELFGDHTLQPASETPNGFLALAVFDESQAGGNGDGSIGPEDGVFPLLAIWIDDGHDGLSQPGELHSLAELGVASINLRYIESWRRDRHGNQLRYKSVARIAGHTAQVTDVFLQRE